MPEKDLRQPADFDPVSTAKQLLRSARAGSLATISPDKGHPLATLVSVATDFDGAPVILISGLSIHTQNLKADARCSLLLAQAGKGDPLAHPRLSVNARAGIVNSPRIRARFLARHPKAALYADFGDFNFWRLEPSTIHLNGGFARAHDGPAKDILTVLAGAETLLEAEAEAIEHMNSDHGEAVKLYATRLCKQAEANWKVTGIDPEGVDMAANERTARLNFDQPVATPMELRKALKQLADRARAL